MFLREVSMNATKNTLDKKIAVCYSTEKGGPIVVFKACSTLEEASKIIISESFKAIKKAEVFVAELNEGDY